jgi:hypothetical protein
MHHRLRREGVLAAARVGVGGSPALRRSSARCCSDVVDDGDPPGTSGGSWGGGNLLLLPRRLRRLRQCNWLATVQIGKRESSRSGSEMGEVEWCGDLGQGRPPFIEASRSAAHGASRSWRRGYRGGESWATMQQCWRRHGDHGALDGTEDGALTRAGG